MFRKLALTFFEMPRPLRAGLGVALFWSLTALAASGGSAREAAKSRAVNYATFCFSRFRAFA